MAVEGAREVFAAVARGDIRSSGFDLNGLWVPWYTAHKLFAGLRDAYRYAGDATALAIATRFAAWAEGIVAKLDAAQMQKMLDTEQGGMAEVLADLSMDTGDARWMALSRRFAHHAVVDPLAQRRRPAVRAARQHEHPEADRCRCALLVHRRAGGRRRGAVLLGPRGEPPQLRDREPLEGRVLPRSRPPGGDRRRPHGRVVQRLQHAEADAAPVRAAARRGVRGVPRTRALQSRAGLDRSRPTARPATWCRWAAPCAASTPTCSRASRAAWAPAWRTTPCTATASTTSRAIGSG